MLEMLEILRVFRFCRFFAYHESGILDFAYQEFFGELRACGPVFGSAAVSNFRNFCFVFRDFHAETNGFPWL